MCCDFILWLISVGPAIYWKNILRLQVNNISVRIRLLVLSNIRQLSVIISWKLNNSGDVVSFLLQEFNLSVKVTIRFYYFIVSKSYYFIETYTNGLNAHERVCANK